MNAEMTSNNWIWTNLLIQNLASKIE